VSTTTPHSGAEDSGRLLALARAGDLAAFSEWFERYRGLVHRAASRLIADAADEVTMVVALKMWESPPEFRGEGALVRWLLRITRNAAMDEWRRRNRREVTESVSAESLEGQPLVERLPAPETEGPAARAEAEERHAAFERALARLSPEHRQTLVLREVDGLDYREIAATTGVSMGTVMSRLFHARRRLRRLLQEELGDDQS